MRILETARAQTVVKDNETLVLAPTGSYSSLRFEDRLQFVVVEDCLDVVLTDDASPDPCERGWTVYAHPREFLSLGEGSQEVDHQGALPGVPTTEKET